NKSTIKCPNCKTEFPIGDAMAKEIEDGIKQRYLERFTKDQKALDEEKLKLRNESEALKLMQENQEKIIADKVSLQKRVLQEEAIKKAAEEMNLQLGMLQKELLEKNVKIKEAQQKELELMQKENRLKEERESLNLELEKKMIERQKEIEDKIKKTESERNELRFKEYEKRLADQVELIETMKRKAEQGSMQLQGEVQELALEELLRAAFPFDTIEEVGKGVKGADCIQLVRNNLGIECGKIIYESKRTKAFGGDWIDKLKADMRSKNADVAVLVTETMPKDLDFFGLKDGVWICTFSEVKALSHVLRDGIIKIAGAAKTQENKGEKMTMLYNYLTGNEFAEQWKAIREGFLSMRLSIQNEKTAMERLWKAREKQLEKVLLNAAHIRGSVDGIAGLESIDLNLLDEGNNLTLD
ncbi:MAG: DUF2130 domain-containing protein, partial [Bacteroidia bacterium]